jgi:peptide/nickel transport system ATP-binding protein
VSERLQRIRAALTAVGLDAATAIEKPPREFSGGERQKIALARALIVEPDVIALDEATSALDTYAKQQILELLAQLTRSRRTSFLFVSHDLATVRNLADRVLVMKDGRVIEAGDTQSVFASPRHSYTAALLAASRDLEQVLATRRESVLAQPELRHSLQA